MSPTSEIPSLIKRKSPRKHKSDSRRHGDRTAVKRIEDSTRIVIEFAENFAHYVAAILLMVIAFVMLGEIAYTLATTHASFPVAATTAIYGMSFVIIVMEIIRTVVTRYDGKIMQVQAVLTIGIVAGLREVLMIGIRLLNPTATGPGVYTMLLELGIYAAVIFGLAAALSLVRRRSGAKSQVA